MRSMSHIRALCQIWVDACSTSPFRFGFCSPYVRFGLVRALHLLFGSVSVFPLSPFFFFFYSGNTFGDNNLVPQGRRYVEKKNEAT